jgi:hypothetical protein
LIVSYLNKQGLCNFDLWYTFVVDKMWTCFTIIDSLTLIIYRMKQLIKFFAIMTVAMLFAVNANGQATASANATATIIAPISITNTADLAFGNVAVSAITAGTVVLTPAGGRSATGGVTLPAVTGTFTAAAFTVNGSGTSTYSITLPASATLTGTPSGTMTVDTFTSTPSGTGALTGGTQNITVGGTLNVGAAQAAGSYTGSFNVTVNYN